jgi:hypothetical protein
MILLPVEITGFGGAEAKIKVTQVTFTAMNLFYSRSIKALSGVNSED